MFCPECGTDAADAKFCPECGAGLEGVRGAVGRAGPRTTASAARRTSGAKGAGGRSSGSAGSSGRDGASGDDRRGGRRPQSSGVNPLYLWVAIAAIAVAVVVAVIVTQGSDEPDAIGGAAGAVGQSELPVPSQGAPKLAQVETNGSYDELVEAGHAYYDSGDALKASGRDDESVGWFAAAAKVYAAAWKLKPGDPALGTDYATSIFYSATTPERIRAAIDQVDKVIATDPDFQMARFNKGIYVSELARRYQETGRTAEAEQLIARARAEYEAAVAIDSASPTGQAAAAALQEF